MSDPPRLDGASESAPPPNASAEPVAAETLADDDAAEPTPPELAPAAPEAPEAPEALGADASVQEENAPAETPVSLKDLPPGSRQWFLSIVERRANAVERRERLELTERLDKNAVFLHFMAREETRQGRASLPNDAYFLDLAELSPMTPREVAEGIVAYLLWRRGQWRQWIGDDIAAAGRWLAAAYIATGWAWGLPSVSISGESAAQQMVDAPSANASLAILTAWAVAVALWESWEHVAARHRRQKWAINQALDELEPYGASKWNATRMAGGIALSLGVFALCFAALPWLLIGRWGIHQRALWFYSPSLERMAWCWAICAATAAAIRLTLAWRSFMMEGRGDPVEFLAQRLEKWLARRASADDGTVSAPPSL
jgi:hypothetical protein